MYAYLVSTFVLCVLYKTATSLPAYEFNTSEANGWSRIPTDGSWLHLVFTCNEAVGWDATVNLEEETLPWDTGALTVRGCDVVQLVLRRHLLTPLRLLTIEEVGILDLVDPAVQPVLLSFPPQVEFINIGKIPKIPSRTFTSENVIKAERITLTNLTIDEISSRAFHGVSDASLIMNSVNVTLIDTDAINLENSEGGFVRIWNCRFGTLEPRSFVLNSPQVEFAGCHIREIREQSLEVTTESFAFLNNIVTDVMSAGFTVSALNISFLGNIFKYLQNRAFEEVTPVKNMKGNVRYEFVDNYIDWAEQGSLQPNYTIYEENRNHTQLRLGSNSFNCTCALVGWLDSSNLEEMTPDIRFRTLILQNKDNICADTSCRLPVRFVNFLLDSTIVKSCATTKQVQDLCNHMVSVASQPSIFSSATVVFLSVWCLALLV